MVAPLLSMLQGLLVDLAMELGLINCVSKVQFHLYAISIVVLNFILYMYLYFFTILIKLCTL